MNKLTIILIFILGYVNCGYCQLKSAEINYKVRVERKLDTSTTRKKELNKILDLVYEEVNFIEMVLKVNNGKTSFNIIEAMDIDDNKKKFFRQRAIGLAGLSSTFFADLNNSNIIRVREFDGRNYNITSTFDHFNWKLTKESKIINKRLCYKAITIKSFKSYKGNIVDVPIFAWYTPEIPLQIGPKNYFGLPGLVLEVKEGSKTYYVTNILLNPENKVVIDIPKKGEVVTEDEYANIISGATQNWIDSNSNN